MKILYVTTVSGTVNAFLIPHIKMLISHGYMVDIACNITIPIDEQLINLGCCVHKVNFSRSPLHINNFYAYRNLKKIINDGNYDLIHTHTPVASALVRLATKKNKDIKVIYTAHGFHFYKGAPLKNWLIYYPIEKWLARYTDVLITINKEDYERAKTVFKKIKKIEYIPGVGLDTNKYLDLFVNKEIKCNELGVPTNAFILLSVGELNKNKNHESIIKALSLLKNPNIYYLICGKGPLKDYLMHLTRKLDLENQIKFLGFRNDVGEILKISDIFLLPSFREGLSVALMEAMACGLPVICSNIRGNRDLIIDNKNGFLVKPNDVRGFAKKIDMLYKNKVERRKMSKNNIESIKPFSINNVISKLQILYNEL